MRRALLKMVGLVWFNLLFINVPSFAQDYSGDSVFYTPISKIKKKSPTSALDQGRWINYFFTLQTGALIGCKDCSQVSDVSFTTSTVHGVTIGRKLRIGAGFGFDSYTDWQTLPIFGAVSWDLIGNKNSNALFVQWNYGGAKAWMNKTAQEYGYKDSSGGRTTSVQLGYRIKYYDLRISFSLGLRSQQVSSYNEYPTFYRGPTGQLVAGTPSSKTNSEELNRLQFSMTLGWR